MLLGLGDFKTNRTTRPRAGEQVNRDRRPAVGGWGAKATELREEVQRTLCR
jgi:hypothetical protein